MEKSAIPVIRVNHRGFRMVVECAKSAGWDLDWFFEGLEYNEHTIPEWISWEDWVMIMNRLGEKAGSDEALREMGMGLFKVPTAVHLLRLVGLFSDLGTMLIRMNELIMRSFFPGLIFETVISEQTNQCTGKLIIPEHSIGCRAFLVMSASAYESMFLSLKVAFSDLSYECTDHIGIYSFHYQSSPTMLERIRRMYRVMIGAEYAVKQIAQNEVELRRRLDIAESARTEAEELRQKEKLARKEAEDALQVRRRFLAIMSHELRTPLNHIIGSASILKSDPLSDDQKEFVDIIDKSSGDLLELIELVLAFTSTGSIIDDLPQNHQLSDVLGATVDIFRMECQKKGLSFHVTQLASLPPVVVHAAHLRQILKLVLENAVKFTKEGHIWLELSGHDSELLRVDVRDTGIGVPASHWESIFEPFRLVDDTDSRVTQGVGLGLPIARKLARQVRGELMLVDSTEKGSTFRLEMPINENLQTLVAEEKISAS